MALPRLCALCALLGALLALQGATASVLEVRDNFALASAYALDKADSSWALYAELQSHGHGIALWYHLHLTIILYDMI